MQSNLRVAVCLDIGRPELLRARLSANPALTSRCAAVAWQGWGEASLLALAKARLEVGAHFVFWLQQQTRFSANQRV